MTVNEVMERVQNGDVNAFIALGDMYTAGELSPDHLRNAIVWYERAVEAGSIYGAMRAVLVHNILAMTNEEISNFESAIDEYSKALETIRKAFAMQDGLEEGMSWAQKQYREIHYKIACCYYMLEKYGASIVFLNNIQYADFETILLMGLCEYELAQNESEWDRVSKLLRSVEDNLLLCDPESNMAFHQQVILTKGYIFLSHIYSFGIGIPKDAAKASEIISLAYNIIPNEHLRELIAEEWKS